MKGENKMSLLSAVRCVSVFILALQGSHANQLHKIQNDSSEIAMPMRGNLDTRIQRHNRSVNSDLLFCDLNGICQTDSHKKNFCEELFSTENPSYEKPIVNFSEKGLPGALFQLEPNEHLQGARLLHKALQKHGFPSLNGNNYVSATEIGGEEQHIEILFEYMNELATTRAKESFVAKLEKVYADIKSCLKEGQIVNFVFIPNSSRVQNLFHVHDQFTYLPALKNAPYYKNYKYVAVGINANGPSLGSGSFEYVEKPIEGDNKNINLKQLKDVKVTEIEPGFGFMFDVLRPHKSPEGLPSGNLGGLLLMYPTSPYPQIDLKSLNSYVSEVWSN